jgi:Fe-S cluster assembly protein SufD
MTLTPLKTSVEAELRQSFLDQKASLTGLAAFREAAFARFAEKGVPHRRVEEWKYTDWRGMLRETAPLAAKPQHPKDPKNFSSFAAHRLVILNGHAFGVPNIEGVEITPLAEALSHNHPLLARLGIYETAQDNAGYALNSAFMSDGYIIHVKAGIEVETPLHLAFIHRGETAFSAYGRVLLVLEEGAALTLLESHEGPGSVAYQPNHVVEIQIGKSAALTHIRLNMEGDSALALSTLTVTLDAYCTFNSLNLVQGSAVSRHQVYVRCLGEHVTVGLRGASMLSGRQHADTTLLMDHAVAHGTSRELFKTVIDDAGTGVFQGKIIVRPDAQKTDGRMMSAALLLSEKGTMNLKPELEIFADDVQCAHGATCGQLDEDLLFYLMARGIPRKEAEGLMITSFLGEVIDEGVEEDAIREELKGYIANWLRKRNR